MTLRNTKGVDILVAAPDEKSMFKAEVRSHWFSDASFSSRLADWAWLLQFLPPIENDLQIGFQFGHIGPVIKSLQRL
jgi:hypothetical protein